VPANPEAIAWYLTKSESLLGDLRERAVTLRTRGGQIAGFSGAVLALAGANVGSVLGGLHGIARGLAGGSILVGVLFLVASVVTVLRGTVSPTLLSGVSVEEVANYVSERFTDEPELWRVHLRTIHGLLDLIELTTEQGDKFGRAVGKAEYFFLTGLFSVGLAFATLIAVMTF
jgi:hypothetical protein